MTCRRYLKYSAQVRSVAVHAVVSGSILRIFMFKKKRKDER